MNQRRKDIARAAGQRIDIAHDRAVMAWDGTEFGTPEHHVFSAQCAVIFDYWQIASRACHRLANA